jgi:hypothetical protein
MKHRKAAVVVAALILVLGTVGIAGAITYGELDGDGHPYVGIVVIEDSNGDKWSCSGTLLSDTVFLTAGHCTFDMVNAWVTFESEIEMPADLSTWNPGTPVPHPQYVDSWSGFPNTYDVGVVILDAPVTMGTYGTLPGLGELDGLDTRRGHQDLVFRTVGYGDQSIKPRYQGDYVRYTATSLLVNLRSNNTGGYGLHTSNNPGKGHGTSGGACFGDSGGPIFYPEDSNQVVAVVSFGMNWNCKGADFAYRTDIAETQDFLDDYLD